MRRHVTRFLAGLPQYPTRMSRFDTMIGHVSIATSCIRRMGEAKEETSATDCAGQGWERAIAAAVFECSLRVPDGFIAASVGLWGVQHQPQSRFVRERRVGLREQGRWWGSRIPQLVESTGSFEK